MRLTLKNLQTAALAALLLAPPAFDAARAEPGDVGPNTSPTYVKECGSCHFPYQPAFLPARSWQKIMGSLKEHFGENAEVKLADRDNLLAACKAGLDGIAAALKVDDSRFEPLTIRRVFGAKPGCVLVEVA